MPHHALPWQRTRLRYFWQREPIPEGDLPRLLSAREKEQVRKGFPAVQKDMHVQTPRPVEQTYQVLLSTTVWPVPYELERFDPSGLQMFQNPFRCRYP